METVATDEGEKTKVGEARGKGEGELDHHVASTIGWGTREDEVGGDEDEDAQEEEGGLGDHYIPSV